MILVKVCFSNRSLVADVTVTADVIVAADISIVVAPRIYTLLLKEFPGHFID